jgi:hypothetical protein
MLGDRKAEVPPVGEDRVPRATRGRSQASTQIPADLLFLANSDPGSPVCPTGRPPHESLLRSRPSGEPWLSGVGA